MNHMETDDVFYFLSGFHVDRRTVSRGQMDSFRRNDSKVTWKFISVTEQTPTHLRTAGGRGTSPCFHSLCCLSEVVSGEHALGPAQDGVLGRIVWMFFGWDLQDSGDGLHVSVDGVTDHLGDELVDQDDADVVTSQEAPAKKPRSELLVPVKKGSEYSSQSSPT